MEVNVDGRAVDFSRTLNYKGMMYSDVPNLGSSFRLHNASWTLNATLTCEYVCRLINYMDRHGLQAVHAAQCRSHRHRIAVAGFLVRLCAAFDREMPKQGSKRPWRLYQNYALDIVTPALWQDDDGVMRYS